MSPLLSASPLPSLRASVGEKGPHAGPDRLRGGLQTQSPQNHTAWSGMKTSQRKASHGGRRDLPGQHLACQRSAFTFPEPVCGHSASVMTSLWNVSVSSFLHTPHCTGADHRAPHLCHCPRRCNSTTLQPPAQGKGVPLPFASCLLPEVSVPLGFLSAPHLPPVSSWNLFLLPLKLRCRK